MNKPDVIPIIKYLHQNLLQFFDADQKNTLLEYLLSSYTFSKNFYDFTYSLTKVTELPFHYESGKVDFLGTGFYLMNSIFEYGGHFNQGDKYGRINFHALPSGMKDSIQSDLVSEYFISFLQGTPLAKFITKPYRNSRVLLTHDVDILPTIILQDAKYLLKNFKIFDLFKVIFDLTFKNPSKENIDLIMNLHDEQDIKSAFFFLVDRGKLKSRLTDIEIMNADYSIKSNKLKGILGALKERKYEYGLHRSVSQIDINHQLKRIDAKANRHHFLMYTMPALYDEIEASSLDIDCSLGHAPELGFRNYYGLPFHPYNLKENKPYSFIEVPFQVMDTTFRIYKNMNAKEAEKLILDFFQKHRSGTILSTIWHNNYFSNYKLRDWLNTYKNILEFLMHNDIQYITLNEIKSNHLNPAWRR